RPERRQLLLQLGRHLLGADLPDEDPQALLEPVALAAVPAVGEMGLGLGALAVVESAIEVGLHHLFALVTRIEVPAHSTALSASSPFRIRRPRCRRDMTVPIGMSRICAASAYEKSPMSTSTSTSRKSCGTSLSASTTSSCDSRSITRSSSVVPP